MCFGFRSLDESVRNTTATKGGRDGEPADVERVVIDGAEDAADQRAVGLDNEAGFFTQARREVRFGFLQHAGWWIDVECGEDRLRERVNVAGARDISAAPSLKHGADQPPRAEAIAASAASALAPSGPPAWAMSGRPPPPFPPSAAAAAFTRSTALKRDVRSSVTPTTMPALPSPVIPTSATTPEPSCFLPSSARPFRSLISIPSTARANSLTSPIMRTP